MADRKARCPDCRNPLAECICDDDDMTPDLPDGAGAWLSRMLGPGPSHSGPPYTHVHKLPETEEEMAAAPEMPPFTISRESE